MLKYDIEREKQSMQSMYLGKEEEMMFTVVRISNLNLENLHSAPLDQKERGFDFAYPDKIGLIRKAVSKDEGLPG